MASIAVSGASSAAGDIWAAATRTLTDIDGDDYTAARAALLDRIALFAAGGAGELTAARAANLSNLDALVSAVWAQAARTLTDLSAEEIFDLPIFDSTYDPPSVSSDGVADTFGAWVELVADVGTGRRLLYAVVAGEQANSVEIEFGEGAGGSEVAVARCQLLTAVIGVTQSRVLPLWRSLTDNARLSAHVQDSTAGVIAYRVAAALA